MRLISGSARAAVFLALVVLASCNGQPAATHHEQRLAAFGTIVTISATQSSASEFNSAIAELEKYFLRVGTDWYPWAPGELAAINAAIAEGRTIAVSAPLRQLLQQAAEIEQRSDGLFNAALGELTELWGFNEAAQTDWHPPAADEVAVIMASAPSLKSLAWADDTLSATGRKLKLDLGGIAKGAILADALRILEKHGVDNVIVDIGGDLMVNGQVDSRAARIGIRQPGTDKAVAWISAASGEAVMTSGNYERYFDYDGKRYAHVLDPRSGYPAADTASVTVVHHDPELADAAATALLVGGSSEFDRLCVALDIEYALLITESGDPRLTTGMQSRVNWLSQ